MGAIHSTRNAPLRDRMVRISKIGYVIEGPLAKGLVYGVVFFLP